MPSRSQTVDIWGAVAVPGIQGGATPSDVSVGEGDDGEVVSVA
ncbi:hypothetical protein [Amycolatopsis palatopharyngis]|nr:hypothetical protein [Amycolatopsis palatopharyngis]